MFTKCFLFFFVRNEILYSGKRKTKEKKEKRTELQPSQGEITIKGTSLKYLDQDAHKDTKNLNLSLIKSN